MVFPNHSPSQTAVEMYAASIHSTTGTLASYAKKIAMSGRPGLEISLDNHAPGKIYTTYDAISGNVAITAPHNARFDTIQITLEGQTKTFIENLSPHSSRARTTAIHNFLKLVMPIKESDYPQPRIAEAGRTYTFPFNFAVPEHLLLRACSHTCSEVHVHNAHLQVPPSMGDREVCGLDDLAPEMARVTYCIKVKILRNREVDGKEVVLVEGQKKIRIVPALPEAPPLTIGDEGSDYKFSSTKSLKKGMFSGKLGKITASAVQPSAVILPSPSSESTQPPTTMASVNLRFDPHDSSSQPPRLGGLTAKIKATTFFGARPAQDLPSHFNMSSQYESTRGVYDTSVSLSSRCVEGVSWEKHKAAPAYTRRNSASSTEESDCSETSSTSPAKEGSPYYTATILVPVTLSQQKTWIPTFHSCIVSRIYSLGLSLTIHTPGTGVPSSTVSLHLPIQVAANGNNTRRPTLTAAEAAAELADAETYLRPRVIETPSEDLVGNSVLTRVSAPMGSDLPPSYEDFGAPRLPVEPGRG
jgi:hypothetical protein